MRLHAAKKFRLYSIKLKCETMFKRREYMHVDSKSDQNQIIRSLCVMVTIYTMVS